MLYQVSHTTSYSYESGVSFCHNIATLKPLHIVGQELVDYRLEISPKPIDLSEKLDFFGNTVTRFSIQEHHTKLVVTAHSRILRDFTLQPNIYNAPEAMQVTLQDVLVTLKGFSADLLDIKQFTLESVLIAKISPAIRDYAAVSFQPNRSVFEAALELMRRIYIDFEFNPKATTVATPIQEVIENKKGVCQDFAQIAIACVRAMGLPARYVSGYIETLPPPGKEKLVGADASHAWFSVYIPSFGWVDFDPTNNQIPKNQHIVVAYGRDYYDVPPLKGVIYSTGKNKLKVAVDIRPVA